MRVLWCFVAIPEAGEDHWSFSFSFVVVIRPGSYYTRGRRTFLFLSGCIYTEASS